MEVVGVTLKENGSISYFDPRDFKLKRNINVVVETERGIQFGEVQMPNFESNSIKKNDLSGKIIRIATKADYRNYYENKDAAQSALEKCRNLARKYELSMNVIDAEYTLDRSQLLFRFVADGRVDFRDLAKELANCYKTRIELFQIGVRDKAKEVGGCGPCGRKLCCSRFNGEFASVSINMAKNQNISLNPTKINGVCGRLLCCLRYENETYKECRKGMPQLGKMVDTDSGIGKVVSLDVINRKYVVQVPSKGNVEVSLEDGSN